MNGKRGRREASGARKGKIMSSEELEGEFIKALKVKEVEDLEIDDLQPEPASDSPVADSPTADFEPDLDEDHMPEEHEEVSHDDVREIETDVEGTERLIKLDAAKTAYLEFADKRWRTQKLSWFITFVFMTVSLGTFLMTLASAPDVSLPRTFFLAGFSVVLFFFWVMSHRSLTESIETIEKKMEGLAEKMDFSVEGKYETPRGIFPAGMVSTDHLRWGLFWALVSGWFLLGVYVFTSNQVEVTLLNLLLSAVIAALLVVSIVVVSYALKLGERAKDLRMYADAYAEGNSEE